MAQSFFEVTPVEVTPGSAGSWQTVDLSAHIPVGATGAIFHLVFTASKIKPTAYNCGLTNYGSARVQTGMNTHRSYRCM